MSDLISREGAINAVALEIASMFDVTTYDGHEIAEHALSALPSVDAVEAVHDTEWVAVRRNEYEDFLASAEAVQGEWTYLSGSKGSYMTISCPICGSTFNGVPEWKYHYCPNCGAWMKGGGDK